MNTLKQLGLLLLALSFSSAALSQGGVKTPPPPPPITFNPPPPPPPTTPKPPPTTGLRPVLISSQPTGGTTYALFFMNTKRLVSSPVRELAALQDQLSFYGLSPCVVTADINATSIKCGNGLVQFGTNELYSYGRPFNLQKVPYFTPNRGVKQVFGANFRSPVGLLPGDSVGRVVHVHFNLPVSQFAMNFDSGQLSAPSIGSVRFVLGTGANAVSLMQPLTAGTTRWVGVQDPAGFTDLDVVSVGSSKAFVTDQFSVVTKTQFIP